ncbi:hydrogenase formation protein HypD, partial [Candidatus Poribacteria bacterium]|nr:hydrogenase formation protein HypD [Candidatus Poribacteria bacterium]
ETDNFYVLSAHKIIPPAMKAILDAEEVMINGFLCPGHVSTIIGTHPYEFIPEEYGVPCVIAGFEPLDILQGILSSVRQVQSEKAEVEIAYRRVVHPQGNPVARKILDQVFRVCDASWRGLGVIPMSGLEIRDEFQNIDARKHFDIHVKPSQEPKGCLCGEVLRGVKNPTDCVFFGKKCTPDDPIGPCMVSSEGTCAAYYKYGGI